MNKEKVTKWLDRMVTVTKQFCDVPDPYVSIKRCDQLCHGHSGNDMPYVHMYKGLHEIAELIDLEVTVDYESDTDICYMFTYKGVDFIQLDDKEA